jgi:hypothetical protein
MVRSNQRVSHRGASNAVAPLLQIDSCEYRVRGAFQEYILVSIENTPKGLLGNGPFWIVRLWISAYAHAVQRLYSMFPAGVPGVALLVLRCCIAAALARTAFPAGWQHVAFLCLLSLVFLGLLTPIACGAAILSVIFDLSQVQNINAIEVGIVLLSTASYACIGPGAYSIDGRLFGRRMLVSTDSSKLEK